jgi:transcriptional regulator with XRE-family HTH domain
MSAATAKRQPIAPGHPGERVTLLRGRQGLLQKDLATAAQVSVDTIRRLEQGYFVPSYPALSRIAAALQTTVSYLVTPID